MRENRISDPYHIYFEKNRLWENITWLGVPMWKLPNDAMIIQEIIYETKPEVIIETGTGYGGSALFYASIFQLIGRGEVLTIDVGYKKGLAHNLFVDRRVTRIIGQSTHPSIIEKAKEFSRHKSTMVILDSCHSEEYVSKELNLYAGLVSVGNYLIVEDTHVGGNPVEWEYGRGPMEAVKKFLEKDKRFEVDKSREKLVMTFNPDGFLRKVS
jgi:cephalosporin hydroxylase